MIRKTRSADSAVPCHPSHSSPPVSRVPGITSTRLSIEVHARPVGCQLVGLPLSRCRRLPWGSPAGAAAFRCMFNKTTYKCYIPHLYVRMSVYLDHIINIGSVFELKVDSGCFGCCCYLCASAWLAVRCAFPVIALRCRKLLV